jgi:hemerythrin-like metal-binding protein
MASEVIVTWHNSYSVGIKLIDEQHMKLIELTNKLFNSCMSGHERAKSNSVFLTVIHEVIDYVTYHFNTEQRVMERINYPEYQIHKQEHTTFAKKVLNKTEEFKLGKINTSLSFVYYLRDWVLHHIAVNDKRLGMYLLEMKKRGDLQQIILKVKKDAVTNTIQIQ